MIFAVARRPGRFLGAEIEVLPPQPIYNLAFQRVGHRRIRHFLLQKLLDAIVSRLCLGRLSAQRDQLAIEFAKLLHAHQPPAGIDDIVLLLEIEHGLFGGRCLCL